MISLIRKIFKSNGVDKTLYMCVVILTIYGIVMIGSASSGQAASMGAGFATINMVKQGVFVLAGFAFMIFLTRCFKKSWINPTSIWVYYAIGIVSMIACLAFGDTKGSHAWIKITSGVTIQPTEFMKVAMILLLAFCFGELEEMCQIPKNISRQKKEELQKRKAWYCLFRPVLAIAVACGVGVFLQKDFGSTVILGFICVMLFFITPKLYYKKYKKLALIIGAILGIVGILGMATFLKGYQMDRIKTWLNPLHDPLHKSMQVANAMIAFATGGLFGKGFGASTQKYGYIPESHNDMISAIIYEELGLVGFLLFLIPYCIIIYKMFNYGMKVKDVKSKLVLYGVGIYFFTHLIINVGGVSGLIPMTGVPLLLISSGGSSTLAAMIAIGIAQSIIARYNRDTLKEQI
ncbi:MAG: FtsW/RodA/SpoVE family cell cycle protein [Coprobacillus sp.]